MSRKPRESVNYSVDLSPEVQAIAEVMGTNLSTRDLIILVSIDQITETGPVDFNSGAVCDMLNLKHPMINYYFGSRDGLIAEALVWAYRGWSEKLMSAVRAAPKNAEKRLRAYIAAELEWAENMKSLTVLIQYPIVSKSVKTLVDDGYSLEFRKLFEYHIAVLSTIIIDLRTGKISDLDFDQTNYPKGEYVLKHSREVIDSTSVAWSIHGISTWLSGSHTPTRSMREEFTSKISEKIAMNSHIENIIDIARGSK
jgi:AcrR family transcriptional regulator